MHLKTLLFWSCSSFPIRQSSPPDPSFSARVFMSVLFSIPLPAQSLESLELCRMTLYIMKGKITTVLMTVSERLRFDIFSCDIRSLVFLRSSFGTFLTNFIPGPCKEPFEPFSHICLSLWELANETWKSKGNAIVCFQCFWIETRIVYYLMWGI